MARNPRRFNRIRALLDSHDAAIRDAFLAAVQDVRDGADLSAIAERLDRGDIDGALRAVNLDPASFRRVEVAVAAAFTAGGEATTGSLPRLRGPDGSRLVVRFDARNLRAEQWVREHSSTLVTRIVDDQRSAIRTALQDGLEAGRNPRNTALDIVGRVNRATGRREGGIVGLSAPQERYVANARAELLSGDPERLRAYLSRERRDRRFDRVVARAIADERPVSARDVSRITGRYSDRLLDLRGEVIARTETIQSLNAGADEAIRQLVDTGAVRREQVMKIWVAATDARTRDTHLAMNGQAVPMDQPFESPSGARLMYPGDSSLGAGPDEIIQCRCTLATRVDFLDGLD